MKSLSLDNEIQAIFLDIGGTLVEKTRKTERDMDLVREIGRLLGSGDSPEALRQAISAGEMEYKKWRRHTLVELSTKEKWSRYLLPNEPQIMVYQLAQQLQDLWSASLGKKFVRPSTIALLEELARRGYILGTISHTSPKYLRDAGMAELFKVMLHAPEYGYRKPHPYLFIKAARRCGVEPEHCAYVGDRPSRDVIGPREAGIGKVILLLHNGAPSEAEPCPMQPDVEINDLSQLLEVFPPREKARLNLVSTILNTSPPAVLYDAAISTMWWDKEVDSVDAFFAKSRALGFARFELNHQISPEVFKSIDLNSFSIGSLHDPCPAVIPSKQLERMDVQITSLDETLRKQAVEVVKGTINQAVQLGARLVVIHTGRITGDHSLDDQLRALFREGKKGTPNYDDLKRKLIADRSERARPHLDSLMESLDEIIRFTGHSGPRLGFENRFHYYEFPVFDELGAILTTFQQPWVGWQLDVGHLKVLDELGLQSFDQYLSTYAHRIVGVHLHDVIGILDHRAPGMGEVDFRKVGAHLPEGVYRTIEVDKSMSNETVQAGLQFLCSTGCVVSI